MGISPILSNVQALPQAMAEILGYFDSFLYQKDGKYRFGSASMPVNFTDAPVIDTANQTYFPQIDKASSTDRSSGRQSE